MKLCDECGINPANIHLTQITQNETHISHLCEECARKKGINVTLSEPAAEAAPKKSVSVPEKTCRQCGCTYAQFRSKGWLGCSTCYQAFEKEIDEMLLQMHGSQIHKGKKYTSPTPAAPRVLNGEIRRLRQELAVAIKNEAFEQAATIRDAIQSMKRLGAQ
ncbi:MAG: UvrB/UvrC motif-containing protein [Chitinispirillaceae bacterium]|nr:UvrB/UvrC motif-containing protein [Chitinispirillaceae bacterium]